jgi:hypothetical protein
MHGNEASIPIPSLLSDFLVTHSPFWLFAGDALTTAAFGLLALLTLPRGVRQSRSDARGSEALAKLRRDRAFWTLFFAQLAAAFVFSQSASSYGLEVTRGGIRVAIGIVTLSPEQV